MTIINRSSGPAGAVYLTTVGYGTGALLGRGITGVRNVYWLDELGIAQAMWLFEVQNFGPFIVDSDLEGTPCSPNTEILLTPD